VASGTLTFAQTSKIKITDPVVKPGTVLLAQGAVDLTFKVNDEEITKVRVIVTANVDAAREDVDIDPTEPKTVSVSLFKGTNKIQLIGFKDGEPDPKVTASISVTCSGRRCGNPEPDEGDSGAAEKPPKATQGAPAAAGVETPKASQTTKNAVAITGPDELEPEIEEAQITYTKVNPSVDHLLVIESKTKLLKQIDDIKSKKTVPDRIRLETGTSTIRVLAFDANNKKLGPDVTKDIIANITAKPEAVILGRPFEVDNLTEFPLSVKLKDQGNLMAKLFFRVSDVNNITVDEGTQDVQVGQAMQQVTVRIGTGTNNIYVAASQANGTQLAADRTVITCTGTCGGPGSGVTFLKLQEPFEVSDDSAAKVLVTPTDPNKKITAYAHLVKDESGRVWDEDSDEAMKGPDGTRLAQRIKVRLHDGRNTVLVWGKDGETAITEKVSTVITCIECKGDSLAQAGSSVYTRAILGFEQSGGSASDSVQKPFLDFFFGAPIAGRESDIVPPRLATWGSVRFASVPQQQLASGGLQSFTSGFLTNIQGLKVNELVHGFDFLAGIDVRLVRPQGKGFVDLDPGTRQNTSVSFVAGFGAINPFSQRQTAQIFAIPKIAGATDPEFLKLFPEAKDKTNIAFVSPERDRFFRQYYGGLRFKTFFYDKHGYLINRFPALLDVTFGQNELVTGKLRNAIFRLEGFYPFPFKSAKFLYLYGTAMMKMGGGGVKNNLPLFLKPPTTNVQLPDDNTVIVPIDRNPNLRSTRDYYRFGLGINLIELLDKLKTPQ
jgi:hypothetical protein